MRAKRGMEGNRSEIFYIFHEAIARKVVATGAANARSMCSPIVYLFILPSLLSLRCNCLRKRKEEKEKEQICYTTAHFLTIKVLERPSISIFPFYLVLSWSPYFVIRVRRSLSRSVEAAASKWINAVKYRAGRKHGGRELSRSMAGIYDRILPSWHPHMGIFASLLARGLMPCSQPKPDILTGRLNREKSPRQFFHFLLPLASTPLNPIRYYNVTLDKRWLTNNPPHFFKSFKCDDVIVIPIM